jgi:hypothetical protein
MSLGTKPADWAATLEEDGSAVLLCGAERHLRTHAFGSLTYGVHLGVEGTLRLDLGAEQTVRAYAVWCREDELDAYASLTKAMELP